MQYLKDLKYENFVELLEYLEELADTESEEEKLRFSEERIQNFFPTLSALQEIELSLVISKKDKDMFEQFKSQYPDLEVDETGTSKPNKKDYWELREKSLESVHQIAEDYLKSKGRKNPDMKSLNKQVCNAKSLDCLENEGINNEKNTYYFLRKLFLDRHPKDAVANQFNFLKFEKALEELGLNYHKFFTMVIIHCNSKKSRDEFVVFLDHLFRRIELLLSDKKLKSDNNRKFLDAINAKLNGTNN
jgi:hypothetical protein